MREVDPNNPLKPLAYIWLAIWVIFGLYISYKIAGYVYNWEFVSIYYIHHPLWYYVSELIFSLALVIGSIYGIIQVYRNRARLYYVYLFTIFLVWTEILFTVVVGMADKSDKILFVIFTFVVIWNVYSLAKSN
ncbi:MAG TPA: hypothetical protein PLK11_03250 [Methanofastidiosum sp.]|nr:hypothetical protein [Methanofastidiosum sp.]HOR88624.1 hypothetical protein [Methanofastidiosum sp.]HOT85611.1 hypothetical protein [Methanofastidiosum sp.]HPL00347.1 hypothetical protein [Methanofastidiosum sp.]